MNQLMDLREEFGLANTAAPALQVVSRTQRLPGMMIADTVRHRPDVPDRAEIKSPPPYERTDLVEETLSQDTIPRRRARPDEGGAFPRKCLRFIIGYRRIHRQHDRRDLGRRAQAQVDAQYVTIGVARLQQFDDAAPDPHRGLLRLFTHTAWHCRRVEDEDWVDIRRIIEFAASLLAEGERREAARLGVWRALQDRSADGGVERVIGEIGEMLRHRGEVEQAGEIADGDRQRDRSPFQPQPTRDRQCRIDAREIGDDRTAFDPRHQRRVMVDRGTEERRIPVRAPQCIPDGAMIDHRRAIDHPAKARNIFPFRSFLSP